MIRVTDAQFDPSDEFEAFSERIDGAGAVVNFLGQVRPDVGDDPVRALYLEHYPGVTEQSISQIAVEACNRWAVEQFLIIHRIGIMLPGEPIVLVCVSARHRRDAFEAADFLMDFLKTRALFWKKEIRAGGERWIEPREQDYEDASRWQL